MVNLSRFIIGDELDKITEFLADQKSMSSGTYNDELIIEALKKEFYSKCYICEDDMSTSINIEHFKPHKGDKDLKFNWNNLYLACSHCNNIKLAKYDNILDCMSDKEDVERTMKYLASTFPKRYVTIEVIDSSEKVRDTAELLTKAYNGTTPQKRLESEKLRKKIQQEMIRFQRLLNEYYFDACDDEDKKEVKQKIKRALSKNSPFAAFKRWVILEEEEYDKEFGDLLA
jgi:uncharacterized protein (TIGR02646 family)